MVNIYTILDFLICISDAFDKYALLCFKVDNKENHAFSFPLSICLNHLMFL